MACKIADEWPISKTTEKAPYTAEARALKVRYEEAMRQWRDQQRTAKQAKLKEYADELRAREHRYFGLDDGTHDHHHVNDDVGLAGGGGDGGCEGGGGGRVRGDGGRESGGVAASSDSHSHDTSPHSQAPPLAFTTTLTSEDGESVQPVLMVLPRPLPPLSQRGLDTIMGATRVPPAPAAHVLALPAGYTVAPHTHAITLASPATITPQPHHA